jgi:hypothetical protein
MLFFLNDYKQIQENEACNNFLTNKYVLVQDFSLLY